MKLEILVGRSEVVDQGRFGILEVCAGWKEAVAGRGPFDFAQGRLAPHNQIFHLVRLRDPLRCARQSDRQMRLPSSARMGDGGMLMRAAVLLRHRTYFGSAPSFRNRVRARCNNACILAALTMPSF